MTDPVVLTDAQIIHDLGTEIARLREDHERAERYEAGLRGEIQQLTERATLAEAVVTAARDVLDRFDRDTIQILKIEAGDGDTPEIDQLRRALDTPGTAG